MATRVNFDGPAAEAGVRGGDVIQEVDRRAVSSAEALRKSLAGGDRPALVLVRRGEQNLFLTVERSNS